MFRIFIIILHKFTINPQINILLYISHIIATMLTVLGNLTVGVVPPLSQQATLKLNGITLTPTTINSKKSILLYIYHILSQLC